MQLASSAQNQEDIMLWRALQQVQNGFYIDVGAADPVDMSVTRVFYDHGWHGINLEPNGEYFTLLENARPRDINLKLGAGREIGRQIFHNISGTGLSTLDAAVAARHQEQGWSVTEQAIETLTLAEICRRHCPTDPIHFLKIDVEGAEDSVLAGADFQAFRPWIVLVEATLPLSQEQSHAEWESFLTDNDYHFVWFDGLNRFYVAGEKMPELSQYFLVQPNVFDGFVPAPVFQRQAEDANHALGEARSWSEAALAGLREEHLNASAIAHKQYETELTEARRQSKAALQQAMEALSRQTSLAQEQESRAARAEGQARTAEDQTHAAEASLAALREQNGHLASQLAHERRAVAEAMLEADMARLQLVDLRASTSWRLTRPLRVLRNLASGQLSGKHFARLVFHRSVKRVLNIRGARRLARATRRMAPGAVEWLALRYRVYDQAAGAAPPAQYHPVPFTAHTLSLAEPMSPSQVNTAQLDLSEEEARLYRSFASHRLPHQATR